jgi:hypothetical protein
MKNPNTPAKRLKQSLLTRWSAEDYPGAEPRFQLGLLGKDIAVFLLLPCLAVTAFKLCESASTQPRRPPIPQQIARSSDRIEDSKSQIIDFRSHSSSSAIGGAAKRSPGTLVRVKLLNVVETFSNAPVHAQIVDSGLGSNLMGGTLIGDATSDSTYERISISFRYARDPNREAVALPISARALSLDGTLGIEAQKKEGFFTRSAIGSAGSATQGIQTNGGDSSNLRQVLFKALTAGLVQEFGSSAQVERNRSQVLTLSPGQEFFAELTDFFPGAGK